MAYTKCNAAAGVCLQVMCLLLAPGYLSVPDIHWLLRRLSQGKYTLLTSCADTCLSFVGRGVCVVGVL
jgi:hypothetical protein